MPPMTFKNEFNVQTMIAVIGLIVALAGGLISGSLVYSSIVAEAGRQSDRIQGIDQVIKDRIALAESRNASMESRMRAVEISQAGQSSDLRSIQVGINDIKASLVELARGAKP